MRFNVSQLLKEGIGAVRTYQLNEVVVFEEVEGSYAVEGEVEMLRTNRSILVTGHLRTVSRELCGRCLESLFLPTPLEIQEEYFPTADVNIGTPIPMPEDAGPFTINKRHILDLSEAVRQEVIVSVPMLPLCKTDCRGLCHDCGHNLNTGPCGCSLVGRDPRWAPLERSIISWADIQR
ncbi:MAG: hypothetical protein HW403_1132 [Dehalococcoidia bacterium]|nr:hypothetical protein [Dehalococcoidia bacterium]